MRATRSDMVTFESCFVPADMVFDELLIPSIGDFLASHESDINLPYTAVYLGIGFAVLDAIPTDNRIWLIHSNRRPAQGPETGG